MKNRGEDYIKTASRYYLKVRIGSNEFQRTEIPYKRRRPKQKDKSFSNSGDTTICIGHLFQGVTLESTIILLILKVYVSYSYCYIKISLDGNIYVSYWVHFTKVILFHFFRRSWRSRYHSSCSFSTWKTNITTKIYDINVTPRNAKWLFWRRMYCLFSGRKTTRAAGSSVNRYTKFTICLEHKRHCPIFNFIFHL